MRIDWKKLVVSLAIPVAGGALAGWATSGGMQAFQTLAKPAFSPPALAFPIAWSILYLLMGISCYLIWTREADENRRKRALALYGAQLAVNWLWPVWFFALGAYLWAFIWLAILLALVLVMISAFLRIYRPAAYLQIPYALWLAFAAYLNLGIALMN